MPVQAAVRSATQAVALVLAELRAALAVLVTTTTGEEGGCQLHFLTPPTCLGWITCWGAHLGEDR